MVDPTDKHSSISSQGIGSDERTDCNHAERLVHIMEIQGKYGQTKKNARDILKQASNSKKGKGSKIYKIPQNFV